MIQLRPYQQAAVDSILSYWQAGGGNPLVDLATGTGKSLVIAKLTQDLLANFPSMRVLMLVHVRELVEQNFQALLKVWPDAPIGIYSAGLGRRDAHHRITFASVQSVFRKAKTIGQRDLILIDEAHLVPMHSEGMYRKLLDGLYTIQPDARVAGFTATPYRLDSGRLDEGKTRLFDKVVYSYGIGDGIADGYLSPLISKASHAAEVDVSSVARRGGEFVAGELETAAQRITKQAVDEMLRFGEHRRSWLVFCSGVRHAEDVRNAVRAAGISAEMVSGETPLGDRDRIIRQFKAGQIRCLTNAQVLTTGFDAPQVDLVAMLRPTLSTSLYVQIVGRGTRLAQGKENCMILDFAGNVRRHGPVDAVSVLPKSGSAGDDGKVGVDSVRAKECPDCLSLMAINASSCTICGHEWPHEEKPKHNAEAEAEVGILSTETVPPKMLPVVDWRFDRHEKLGSPDSVRVTYTAGLMEYREWLAFEHRGYAQQKAAQWWVLHGGATPFPKTVAEALDRWEGGELMMPNTISVKPRPGTKYMDICGRTFAETKERAA